MNKIDPIDLKNLEIIRKGVKEIIRDSALKFDHDDVLLLDVAPQDWDGAREFFKKSTIHTLDIDKNSNATFIADITVNNSALIKDNTYNIVIFTEVLEHTLNPFFAIDEVYRILKPGGLLIMTTPFNFRIHNPLPDCWRFSEHGLKELLKSFSEIEIEPNGEERFLFPVQYKTIAKK